MFEGKIARLVRERGITYLYHFTPMANLQSILTHGLLSAEILDERKVSYTYTDGWRNDGQPAAVSLSIHGINETMFAAKQKNANCTWAILEIEASVLWTHHCRFCWVNAASSEIVNHRGRIDGLWAFNEMFVDRPLSASDPRSSRLVYQTPANMPTMNAAEVQVLEPIAPELIRDITVAREICARVAEAAMQAADRTLPVVVVPTAFA